jgi:hypothetical protein
MKVYKPLKIDDVYVCILYIYILIKCANFNGDLFLAIPVITVIKPKDQKEKKIDLQPEVSTDLVMSTFTYI